MSLLHPIQDRRTVEPVDVPSDGGHVRTRAVDLGCVREDGRGEERDGRGGKNFGKIGTHVGSG